MRSDDLGATWQELESGAVRFPADLGASVEQVWQLQPGPADRPDEVWAGVEPAALFRSDDGGETFSLVRGLWDHPHRPQWQPGAGGMCLHTVLPHPTDPDRVLIAISAGGVYRSEDAGESWHASNSGIEARFMPDPNPEFGQCVHKVARLPEDPDHLIAQNHGGVFRSTDDGRSWALATAGLPADFGFGVVAHPTGLRHRLRSAPRRRRRPRAARRVGSRSGRPATGASAGPSRATGCPTTTGTSPCGTR